MARILRGKNTYVGANSKGWPARFIGVSIPKVIIKLAGQLEGCSGIHMGPGTAFTQIPRDTKERDSKRVKLTIAPLLAE